MTSIHDAVALDDLRRRCRVQPERLRQFRNAIYKKQRTPVEALLTLPESARHVFQSEISFHALDLVSRRDSRFDGASKLLFETARGERLETVLLRIDSGRTSLCVSSQVGCAVRCTFCATGQMAAVVNLSRDEILDQVIQANLLLRPEGRSVRNVVFMGMGEPFHNEEAVGEALEALLSPRGFGLTPGRVLVSTVGIPEAMTRCARRFPRLGMALSLHAARQERRERIIPLARRYSLDALRATIADVTAIQGRPLMIEVLLLDGVNDDEDDSQALIDYLRGLSVHINLIPYNSIEDARGLSATSAERRREFAASLRAAGFVVTIRRSLGNDIAAACGQLARRES